MSETEKRVNPMIEKMKIVLNQVNVMEAIQQYLDKNLSIIGKVESFVADYGAAYTPGPYTYTVVMKEIKNV